MTEVEALELGREAVGCPGWRWLEGMVDTTGRRVASNDTMTLHPFNVPTALGEQVGSYDYDDPVEDPVPDFRDPCTAGGLLALVREAWGEPNAYVRCQVPGLLWVLEGTDADGLGAPCGPTEIHALVSALRAAPVATR